MPLRAGSRIGPYEITAEIGAGGMGIVYRARDTKLQRDVALKVLPDHFEGDSERLARFQREAQVLASLNHPNIAAIYGLEEADGVRALVLEFVEGPTLQEIIVGSGPVSDREHAQSPKPKAQSRALSIEEALPIARQIAEALEAAHEHGIIHRDLKPANVKVRPDGTVKVLDFSLAKLTDPTGAASVAQGFSPGEVASSQAPTLTTPAATRMGVIMGTAAYMSPEQAKGQPVDKRGDLWAFGCVLYEMLTGRRAFDGDDVSDTMARVLMKEPEWDAVPVATSPAIRKLLRRCLAKDRRQRLSDAAGVRLEIEEALTTPSGGAATVVPSPPMRTWRRVVGVAVASSFLLGSFLTGAVVWQATRPAPPRVTRTTITPPVTAPLTLDGITRDLAIAPDGSRVVYVGANGTQLFVRALDQLAPIALTGLGAPRHPVFSPDGQWIAFFDGTATLKKVATTGGPAVTLTRASGNGRGASWGPDGTIVFATIDATGLLRVGAAGGEAEVLTTPDRAAGEVDHLWPEVLPGGEAALFTITTTGGIDQAHVAVLDLRTGDRRVLVRGGSHAQYVVPGYLVYAAVGTLRAVAFDLARRDVVGAPVPVVEGVNTTPFGVADASVTADGTLVYVPSEAQSGARRTLVWVDRQGREESLGAPARGYLYPRLSPDGAQVAFSTQDQELDIWRWDLARQAPTRVTFDPAPDLYPVWTPDGRQLLWASGRAGPFNLYVQEADGTGAVDRLTDSPNPQFPYAMTSDGKHLVLREDGPGTGEDLALLELGQTKLTPLIRTTFDERNGELSPDGRWLAYESSESGRSEIYVRPFPAVDGGKWQVSTGGGRQPLWARSGRELFYRGPDGAVLGVRVDAVGSGGFRAGTATMLVPGRYFGGAGAFVGRTYDVSPDGTRFLMIKEGDGSDQTAPPPSIVIVQHWVEELKRLVPTNGR